MFEQFKKLHPTVVATLISMAIGAAVVGYVIYKPSDPIPQREVWTAPPDPVAKAPIIDVKVKRGTVRVKKSADVTLKIPLNPNEGVISAASIASNDHPVTVATVIDTDTGISRTVVREEPLPWFVISHKGEIGMYYGLKNGAPGIMLQARQEIVQVKAIRIEAIGQVTQSPVGGIDNYVGIGLTYRW